ncbi:hypothetical protein SARC_16880, partial [Sphaeroforma arctica JP610]
DGPAAKAVTKSLEQLDSTLSEAAPSTDQNTMRNDTTTPIPKTSDNSESVPMHTPEKSRSNTPAPKTSPTAEEVTAQPRTQHAQDAQQSDNGTTPTQQSTSKAAADDTASREDALTLTDTPSKANANANNIYQRLYFAQQMPSYGPAPPAVSAATLQ